MMSLTTYELTSCVAQLSTFVQSLKPLNLTTWMAESMIDEYTSNVAKYFALISFVYFIFS
jgi:hypothetical protein